MTICSLPKKFFCWVLTHSVQEHTAYINYDRAHFLVGILAKFHSTICEIAQHYVNRQDQGITGFYMTSEVPHSGIEILVSIIMIHAHPVTH